MTEKFAEPDHFTNRELSWLDFNYRVLEEARDKENPLLERLKFLAITASNLDEFFMVRVASLKKMVSVDYKKPDAAGLTPRAQLHAINEKTHQMTDKQYNTWNRTLLKLLGEHQINLRKIHQLTDKQMEFIKHYFEQEIYPVVTPMAVDSARPFPLIVNTSLNIAALIYKEDEPKKKEFATVQVPTIFPRVVKLPDAPNDFILLEEIIKHYLARFFLGYKLKETACYRIMRNMDMDVAEQDASDLLKEIEEQLKKRERSAVIRLEVEAEISKHLSKRLVKALKVDEDEIYRIKGPLDLTFLGKLAGQIEGHRALVYPPFKPYLASHLQTANLFELIRSQDIFLHHPYDSFQTVVDFIRQAAHDPDVLAIKMTLYRVSGDSPIIRYLGEAAENGKQVTVLLEVKARFDEENNIHWAQELEKAGCHVIYGLIGLKTHCKLTLVVRREADGIRRYMHMGTGNYNDITARFYTDLGLLTADAEMGIDASNIFNMISGYSEPPVFHQLTIAPHWLRSELVDQIEQEAELARQGKPAIIKMKMNSLSDTEMIKALYQASEAGVKIELLIRGICCLRAGVKGLSENITVHSIVGRLLEHSRIYYFGAGGEERLYLSSADLMHRNLNRRVELLFPIQDEKIRQRIMAEFGQMFADNVKTRVLRADGSYHKLDKRGKQQFSSQQWFMEAAEKKSEAEAIELKSKSRVFIPMKQEEDEE
ncbi:RNA degradosome polyphosphate kinase [Listeria costaricensis]|uniref:RNA degradosome polyphosphate kinase n=1 Tax=Listeria costaricensis TaxID=2026604 RepID=UPI000C0821FD|nr:RNA degradosome polyphosphate kinase [Listeria costaricensis]